jgi:protein TonB
MVWSVDPDRRPPRRWLTTFGAVALAHGALLWWLATALGHPPAPVTQPVMVARLVAPAPVTEPQPLPVQPTPPRPRPVARPRPAPAPQALPAPPVLPTPPLPTPAPLPVPVAAPSERAVTAAPADAAAPAAAEAAGAAPSSAFASAAASASAAATAAPAAPAAAEPIIGPRSDAAHLSNPAPVYPAISRRLGEQGRVLLDVHILPDGGVGQIRVRRSSGFARLDQAALTAVRHWRFVPAKRGGEPIAYWYVQPIDFALH